MTFLNPLGLLCLIGIPVIVVIYILRNRFNEQTVTSTYLWTLSEKFFKRRNPFSGLTGIISLVLQLLTVVAITLAVARPVFVLPESAGEYCIMIDASGSMNMRSEGSTRFERAKREAAKVIRSAKDGSSFTLMLVADEVTMPYEQIDDKKLALDMLDELECTDGTAFYNEALSTAQGYFNDNPSTIVHFFTDKDIEEHDNIEIVNLSSQKDYNYSLSGVKSSFMGGQLTVSADVVSHAADATVEVELYVDGAKDPADAKEISLRAAEKSSVEFTLSVASYESYRIVIKNKDSLGADNEFIGYNVENDEAYNVLIVSETPFFLEAALDVLTDASVDTVKPTEYNGQSGYGLYIFQSYTPDELPDAAVWLINSSKSVDDSGFGARGVVELADPVELSMSASTASSAKKLLTGVSGKDIYVSEYVKYSGMYTKFTTLFSYEANPLIFAGVNGLGNREVVIGFDIHKADISLSTDFVALLGNLLDYSCPDIVDKTVYTCGETVEVNITSQIRSVKAIAPDGEEIYIDTATDIGSFNLDKVGTYRIDVNAEDGEKTYMIYSGAPESEGNPASALESFSLAGEQEYELTDGRFDPIVIVLICLALLLTADWMVYCYEKYQLR